MSPPLRADTPQRRARQRRTSAAQRVVVIFTPARDTRHKMMIYLSYAAAKFDVSSRRAFLRRY